MAQGLRVAARGELGGDEQRHDAAGAYQLEGPLGERDREIGEVCEAAAPPRSGGSPAGVAGRERLPHTRRQSLRPHPGRVSHDHVEAATPRDVAEVRFEREEGNRAVALEFACRGTKVAQVLARPGQPDALRRAEAAPATKEVEVFG